MRPAHSIIKSLQVTEKGSRMTAAGNKYLCLVDPSANKIEIRRAVETLFRVSVAAVNTMNYLGKKKRLRTMRYGRTADWKRAVVTLKEGSKIEIE